MKLTTFLQFIFFAIAVNAAGWTRYSHEYYASNNCKLAVDKVADFCGKPEAAKKYACICKNKNALVSWLNCGFEYFPNISQESYVQSVIDQCLANSKVNSTTMNEKYLMKLYDDNKSKIVDVKNFTSPDFPKNNTAFPISGKKISKTAILGYQSSRNRWGNVSASHYLGIGFVAACGAIGLIAGLINWSIRFRLIDSLPKILKKNVTLALFGKNHLHSNSNILGVNPDRLETILIGAMLLFSILANFILGYNYMEGDTIFAKKQTGLSRYYGDRSAILCSYQLPLLFLFPGRNNFFQYITRWKQARFVTFHKWLARIVIAEVLIHSFALGSQTASLPKFSQRIDKAYFREGIAATVFGFSILILSFGYIRKFYYELFLFIHIVFVACFLWLSYLHALDQNYQQFYWACCGVWIFDRFIRILRILSFGVKKVEVEYFPGEEIIKLSVPKSSLQKPHPGSHAFIHFLTPTKFLQSHPFTAYPSPTDSNIFHFNCRVKKGITRYIADKCKSSGKNKISMKILIDGFYGEQSPYQNYDKTVLITGGTGLSGPYYHAKNLSVIDSNREVKLYWSIKSYQGVKSYLNEILSFKDTIVKPIIYISKPEINSTTTSSDDNEKRDSNSQLDSQLINGDELDDEKVNKLLSSFAEIRHGRMVASEIVQNEINESKGSIAFGACAHTEVVDEIRTTVANCLSSTTNRVDYYEEMQLW